MAKPAAGAPFEHAKWSITLVPDAEAQKAGEKPIEDILLFEDGKLTSLAGKSFGFAPSKYEHAKNWFSAEVLGPNQQTKCVWRGDVTGDALRGTMVATRNEGTIVKYTFEGRQASPLEGTRWLVRLEPDAAARQKGEKARDAVLVFERNKISVAPGALDGFAPATYTLTKDGERWLLQAELASEAAGRALWKAELQRDTVVKGTLQITAKDGSSIQHTLTGQKQSEPVKKTGDVQPVKD